MNNCVERLIIVQLTECNAIRGKKERSSNSSYNLNPKDRYPFGKDSGHSHELTTTMVLYRGGTIIITIYFVWVMSDINRANLGVLS
jgi:hypothetical protein